MDTTNTGKATSQVTYHLGQLHLILLLGASIVLTLTQLKATVLTLIQLKATVLTLIQLKAIVLTLTQLKATVLSITTLPQQLGKQLLQHGVHQK